MMLNIEPENQFLKAHEIKKVPDFKNSKDLKSFIIDFESYYNENFGFRESIYSAYARFKYETFKESAAPKSVLVGTDGWLFLGNDFGNVIDEYAGIEDPENELLNNISNKIRTTRKWLRDKQIDLFIVIAPNKHSVYGEYLGIKRETRNNYTRDIIDYVKGQTGFKIINLTSVLINNKEQFPLYYKTDTHWNDLGAFIGYTEIMRYLKQSHADIEALNLNDFELKNEITNLHDLNKILRFHQQEEHIKLIYRHEAAKKDEKRLSIPEDYEYNKNNYEMRFSNAAKKKKILIFRDSFSTALVDYFKESFGETVIIWSHKFDKNLVLDEKPDIVLFELVERDIDLIEEF